MSRAPLELGVALRAASACALCVVLLTSAARADVCIFDLGPVDWTAITSGASNDCASPGPADSFVVPSGSLVTIRGDILYTSTADADGQTITVEDGGTLICRYADGCTEIALDSQIECEAGSTCRFSGHYLEFDGTTPAFAPELSSQSGAFPAGAVIPCAGWNDLAGRFEPDCDGALSAPGDLPGGPYRAALVYPYDDYDGPEPSPDGQTLSEIQATLDAISPGDILFWHDPTPDTPDAPVDENFAYEITLAESDYDARGSYAVLAFDVRQTNLAEPRIDSGVFPDFLKGMDGATLARSVSATSGNAGTQLETAPTLLPGTTEWAGSTSAFREERVGMFARFDCAGTGLPCDEVFRIVRVFNDMADGSGPAECLGGSGQCDVLDLYSPAGFPWSLAPGTAFWIDYGWKRGDAFGVMQMVHIHNAGPIQGSTKKGASFRMSFRASEASLLRATIVEDSQVRFGNYLEDPLGCNGANTVIEDVWIRDPLYRKGASSLLLHNCRDLVLRRIHKTGGAVDPSVTAMHGVTWGNGGTSGYIRNVHFLNFGWRHSGDDWISGGGSLTETSDGLLLHRARFQFASNSSDSQSYTSTNHHPTELRIVDGECVQCTNPDNGIFEEHDVEGFLAIGAGGALSYYPGRVEDLTALGNGYHTLNENVNHFVLAQGASWKGVGAVSSLFDRTTVSDARNGIIRDFGGSGSVIYGTLDLGTLSNLLFLEVYRVEQNASLPGVRADCDSVDCRVGGIQEPATFLTLERISHVFRPGSDTGRDLGIRAAHQTAGRQSIDGLLFAGTSSGPGLQEAMGGAPGKAAQMFQDTVAGPCTGTGVVPGNATILSLLPPTAVVGVDLELVDPAGDVFTPQSGGQAQAAGCGIYGGRLSPGIHTQHVYHWWLGGVAPENAGRSGAAYGAPAAWWEMVIEGIASGGEVRFRIEGLPLEAPTSPGDDLEEIVDQIVQAINANATLQSFGIEAIAISGRVYVRGAVSTFETTDATLTVSAAPGVPPDPVSLPALGITGALVLTTLLTLAEWASRRAS